MSEMIVKRLLASALAAAALLSACAGHGPDLRDGYYTAEAASYDAHGWKDFVTVYISDGRIVTVEYNAKNASGFIKSWDMDYMRAMSASDGTYPNEYTRAYAVALLNRQRPSEVDAVSGATHSHAAFQVLAEAALARSREGDGSVAFVELTGAGQ